MLMLATGRGRTPRRLVGEGRDMTKLWANSGDSHLVEPGDLFTDRLSPALAERMPRSVKDEDGSWETIYVERPVVPPPHAAPAAGRRRDRRVDVGEGPGVERSCARPGGPRCRRCLGGADVPLDRHVGLVDP